MKLMNVTAMALMLLVFLAGDAIGLDVNYANKGTDDVLVVTENYQVNLSQALPGRWDDDPALLAATLPDEDPNTAPGRGVYDVEKWAIIFKYKSVKVDAGKTLSFSRDHPANPPVVWLVDGDVEIDGTVSLDGQSIVSGTSVQARGGPGGFRGGFGNVTGRPRSAGFGPGGARNTGWSYGSYFSVGRNGTRTYGSKRVLPLIGGSGGGGDTDSSNSGAGGGGAILIVARGSIRLNGAITAYGAGDWHGAGGGSGGAIRIVSESLSGSGYMSVAPGSNHNSSYPAPGRIRVETNAELGSVTWLPATQRVFPDDPVLLWPPDGAPAIRIIRIDGLDAPADPVSRFGQEDLTIDHNPDVSTIVLETENVVEDAEVYVRVTPKSGPHFEIPATVVTPPDAAGRAIWHAERSLPTGPMALQARAINPPPASP